MCATKHASGVQLFKKEGASLCVPLQFRSGTTHTTRHAQVQPKMIFDFFFFFGVSGCDLSEVEFSLSWVLSDNEWIGLVRQANDWKSKAGEHHCKGGVQILTNPLCNVNYNACENDLHRTGLIGRAPVMANQA